MKFFITVLSILTVVNTAFAGPIDGFNRFKLGMTKSGMDSVIKELTVQYSVSIRKISPLKSIQTTLEIKKNHSGVYRYILLTNQKNKLFKIEVHMKSNPSELNSLQKRIENSLKISKPRNIKISTQIIDSSGKCRNIGSPADKFYLNCTYNSKGMQICRASHGICTRILKDSRYSIFFKKYKNSYAFLELIDKKFQPAAKEVNVNFREFD